MEAEFGEDLFAEKVTPGDATLQALLLLGEVPEYQAPMTALINGSKSESYAADPASLVAVVTAARGAEPIPTIYRNIEI